MIRKQNSIKKADFNPNVFNTNLGIHFYKIVLARLCQPGLVQVCLCAQECVS